ncbi:uncharacterized protein LOC128963993 [Oppia nitens]|uniref:uncharacterized protein LOC128963993 n=1 Tax=Oppia nitens TaxID=1686743 RepID=UPI0023DAAB54|nr:uncharacterized protein LOC128963993 [Oppia nitens]
MLTNYIILLNCVLYLSVNKAVSQKYDCKRGRDISDIATKDMFLFAAENRKFPINAQEMKQFCKESPELDIKVKTFNDNCLKGITKQISNLYVYSVNKFASGVCKSKRRTIEFLSIGQCGNAANKSNKKCWDNWLFTTDSIGDIKDDKLKIPLSCCLVARMRSCLEQSFEKKPKQCKKQHIEVLDNMFNTFLVDSMAMLCGDYTEDGDKCDKIVNKIPNRPFDPKKKLSPIIIMTKILSSFPE